MMKLKWGELVDHARVPRFSQMPVAFETEQFSGKLFVVDQHGKLIFPRKPYPTPWFGPHRVTFGYVATTPMHVGILATGLQSSDRIDFDVCVEMVVRAKDDGLERIARERGRLDELFQSKGRSFADSFFKEFEFAQIFSRQPNITNRFQTELTEVLNGALPYHISDLLLAEIIADDDVTKPLRSLATTLARLPAEEEAAKIKAASARQEAKLRSETIQAELEAEQLVSKAIARIQQEATVQLIENDTAITDKKRKSALGLNEEYLIRERSIERETALFAEEIKLISAQGDARVMLEIAQARLLESQRKQEERIALLNLLVSSLKDLPPGESSITFAAATRLLEAEDNPDALKRALGGLFEREEHRADTMIQMAQLMGQLERETDRSEIYRGFLQTVGSALSPSGGKPVNVNILTDRDDGEHEDLKA